VDACEPQGANLAAYGPANVTCRKLAAQRNHSQVTSLLDHLGVHTRASSTRASSVRGSSACASSRQTTHAAAVGARKRGPGEAGRLEEDGSGGNMDGDCVEYAARGRYFEYDAHDLSGQEESGMRLFVSTLSVCSYGVECMNGMSGVVVVVVVRIGIRIISDYCRCCRLFE
jgi:hypothetical protein